MINKYILIFPWLFSIQCSTMQNIQSPYSLTPLPAAEIIKNESVIGAFPLSESGIFSAVKTPNAESILKDVKLMTPVLEDNIFEEADSKRGISNEINSAFGGWLSGDLTAFITLHTSLDDEHKYPDAAHETYYCLLAKKGDWVIQIIGNPGTFHCVSLCKEMLFDQVMEKPGFLKYRPLGKLHDFLVASFPQLRSYKFNDTSGQHAKNVYDYFLVSQNIEIKAGTRVIYARSNHASYEKYIYAIRINIKEKNP